ncbi:hypothetical protein FBUS_00411 [Fasciolopsis buskii]|uniref:Uncharacterized protein n=1 Tax=Fasciolopsis buskii TaxID=27845 RepID=A0A8E0RMC3_9TREM|nr:hypothetical protein FBUS_00411 [Fasciolopsis buski]
MQKKKAALGNYTLCAKLLHQPAVLAGSTLHCSVELRKPENHEKFGHNWSITGLVGWVVGQFKLDRASLIKQNLSAPVGLTFDHVDTQEASNLWFDCKSSVVAVLGTDAEVFYCEPMRIQPNLPDNTDNITAVLLSALTSVLLPPSVRGYLFKAAYKLIICVQLTSSQTDLSVRTETFQLPFRVLPALAMYHSLRAPDGTEMKSAGHNVDKVTSTDPRSDPVSLPPPGLRSNPFWCDDRVTAVQVIDHGLIDWPGCIVDQLVLNNDSPRSSSLTPVSSKRHRYPSEPLINAGQLRSSLSLATDSRAVTFNRNQVPSFTPFDPFGSNDQSDVTSEQSFLGFSCLSPATQPATFIISCAQGTVGRLCLLRTLFRMDDVIRGYFEFSETQVPCLGCHLSLQYEERYLDAHSVLCESTDPDTFGESPNNSKTLFASLPLNEKGEPETVTFKLESECSRVTTVTDLHLACLSKQLLPFTLPIPISATPQFCAQNKLLLIDGRWRLRLEFILSRDTEWFALGTKPPGSSTTDSVDGLLPDVWKLPSFLPTEKLAWHLPIQLVSSDPSMMCLPRTTSTMPVLLPVF